MSAAATRSSTRLFVLLGVCWLLFAAFIVGSQLLAPPSIEVTWETETEINNIGFNIYRSEMVGDVCATQLDEGYVQINDELIDSTGDPIVGDDYSYIDDNVDVGVAYCYLLEDVEASSNTELHTPFDGEAVLISPWAIVLAAFSALVGLALLVSGIRGS